MLARMLSTQLLGGLQEADFHSHVNISVVIRIAIGCMIHVKEMHLFLLHLLLELVLTGYMFESDITASNLEKLQYKIREKALYFT